MENMKYSPLSYMLRRNRKTLNYQSQIFLGAKVPNELVTIMRRCLIS